MVSHRPYRRPRAFVLPVRVDPSGTAGPKPGAARGPRWDRVGSGLFVPAGTDRSLPEQRVAEASGAVPPGGAITGWASLLMQGCAFLDGRRAGGGLLPVEVVVPDGCHPRARPGVRFVQGSPGRPFSVGGVPCQPASLSVFNAMRLAEDVREAVVHLDMAAAAEVVTIDEVRRLVRSRASWRGVPGVPQVREALELAIGNSASPPETRLRLVWVLDAGLPPPLVNVG